MKIETSKKQLIIKGNIENVILYLKECEKNYVYVTELIDELAKSSTDNPFKKQFLN